MTFAKQQVFPMIMAPSRTRIGANPHANPGETLRNTRDESCETLLYHINLNRYDHKFMANIHQKYIKRGRGLTLKQIEVVDKIIFKYRKQLRKKLQIDYKDMLAQKWTYPIVTLSDLFKDSYLKVEDGIMKLHFHFDRDVINKVRSVVHDDNCTFLNKIQGVKNFGTGKKYNFIWSNEKEEWFGEFNPYLFKELLTVARVDKIRIDHTALKLEEELNSTGSADEWASQIKIINDRIYINCIAETMIFDDIDLTDLSEDNIEFIVQELGVLPPHELYDVNTIKLMESTVESSLVYNTNSLKAQDALREYLAAGNHKTLFYLPVYVQISALNEPESTFITEKEMENWPGVDVIMHGRFDSNGSINVSSYDTFVTVTPVDNIISDEPFLGEAILSARKYIRIT